MCTEVGPSHNWANSSQRRGPHCLCVHRQHGRSFSAGGARWCPQLSSSAPAVPSTVYTSEQLKSPRTSAAFVKQVQSAASAYANLLCPEHEGVLVVAERSSAKVVVHEERLQAFLARLAVRGKHEISCVAKAVLAKCSTRKCIAKAMVSEMGERDRELANAGVAGSSGEAVPGASDAGVAEEVADEGGGGGDEDEDGGIEGVAAGAEDNVLQRKVTPTAGNRTARTKRTQPSSGRAATSRVASTRERAFEVTAWLTWLSISRPPLCCDPARRRTPR